MLQGVNRFRNHLTTHCFIQCAVYTFSLHSIQWRIQKVVVGGAKEMGVRGVSEFFLKSGHCRRIVGSFRMYSKKDELNNIIVQKLLQ